MIGHVPGDPMNTALSGFVLHNRSWSERVFSLVSRQPHGISMLQRSSDIYEVSMFCLIALYFEYRNAQAAHILATSAAVELGHPANDVSSVGIARAA